MLGFRGQFIDVNMRFCRVFSPARCSPVVDVLVVNVVFKQQKRENDDTK
jgi:hypothetical protein